MKRTIRVDDADWAEWQKAAKRQRCTVADVVRRAVNAEISKHKPRSDELHQIVRDVLTVEGRHLFELWTQQTRVPRGSGEKGG